MVLQNAGYPGGEGLPHSVPPVARYCTPRRTAYHGTGAAEEQGSSSPRRRGNEVMGTTVPADPLVKRDTLRRVIGILRNAVPLR